LKKLFSLPLKGFLGYKGAYGFLDKNKENYNFKAWPKLFLLIEFLKRKIYFLENQKT